MVFPTKIPIPLLLKPLGAILATTIREGGPQAKTLPFRGASRMSTWRCVDVTTHRATGIELSSAWQCGSFQRGDLL